MSMTDNIESRLAAYSKKYYERPSAPSSREQLPNRPRSKRGGKKFSKGSRSIEKRKMRYGESAHSKSAMAAKKDDASDSE